MDATRRGLLIGGAAWRPRFRHPSPWGRPRPRSTRPPRRRSAPTWASPRTCVRPSRAAHEAAVKAMADLAYYGWELEPPLVKAIAQRDGLKAEQVGLCNGSLEALSLLSTAFAKAGPVVSASNSS
ncbi:hypothetical protein ACRAWD_26430 [Caulobacter segnis]